MRVLRTAQLRLTPSRMERRTLRPRPSCPRSAGVHVQAINKHLAVAAGKMQDSESENFPFEKFSRDNYPWMPALGAFWEESCASLYPEDELLWQPGEWERDGILGTPDGLLLCEPMRIWECKRTTMKIRSVAECWLFLKQGLAYCALSGGITQVQWDVLWVLGDYSRPYQPRVTSTVVEFETYEVESWWGVLQKAKDQVKPEEGTLDD